MMPFQQLLDLMVTQDIAQLSDLVGVPLAEIQAMELHFNLKFPISYVQFLHSCGRSAGHLAGWSAIYFDDLKEIADEFEFYLATLQDHKMQSGYTLPDKALLIAHYESHFDYIICTAEDQAVYRLNFSGDHVNVYQFSDTFNEYIESMIHAAGSANGRVAPFFIDECGNMIKDDLKIAAPAVE